MDNNFDNTLKKLSDQVNQLTSTGAVNNKIDIVSDVPNKGFKFMNINSPIIYYLTIPIVISILLYIFKPKFVIETISKDGHTLDSISYKRILISTFVFTTIILLGYYGYNYKITSAS